MKVYHIERDYTITAAQQKKQLEKQYTNFNYLFSDRHKIHFAADEEPQKEKNAAAIIYGI